ncbi:Aminoacyl tRNA synthase complex-interacting multifunctional protein 1 [Conglomerata obtusa]
MKLCYGKKLSDLVFSFKYMQMNLEFEETGEEIVLHADNFSYIGLLKILEYLKESSDYIDSKTYNEITRINKLNFKDLLRHTKKNNIIPDNLKFEDVYLFTKVYRAIKEGTIFTDNELEYFNRLMEKVDSKIQVKKINDFDFLDIRAGKIIAIKEHESADKLYIETVLFEEGKQLQILSGLRNCITKEELLDQTFLFMLNLKENVLRGEKSQGMILCVKNEDVIEPLKAPSGLKEGSRVIIDGNEQGVDITTEYQYKIFTNNNEKFKFLMQKLNVKNYTFCFGDQMLKINGHIIQTKTKEGNVS